VHTLTGERSSVRVWAWWWVRVDVGVDVDVAVAVWETTFDGGEAMSGKTGEASIGKVGRV